MMFAVNNEHPEIVQLRVPAATAAALPLPAAEASVVRLENKANITRAVQELSDSVFVRNEGVTHSFFTDGLSPKRVHGVGQTGGGCRTDLGAVLVASQWSRRNDLVMAASTHAHELGHTMGMR